MAASHTKDVTFLWPYEQLNHALFIFKIER